MMQENGAKTNASKLPHLTALIERLAKRTLPRMPFKAPHSHFIIGSQWSYEHKQVHHTEK